MGGKINFINIVFFLFLAGYTFPLQATPFVTQPSLSNNANLAVDGPYIFYHRDKAIVKSIQVHNSTYKMVKQEYDSRADIPQLSCVIDKNRKFNINLHESIETPATTYTQPDRLFAISDIEGNFHAFAKTLIGNGVIDEQFNWIYGDGHLVLVGDFFDRGLNVTACLWLIYELESQAKEQGGVVHFILGNHEEMNLSGDYRYVRKKYQTVAKELNCSYADLFGTNTELGRWLRSKNMVEKIGETIFVHGGLSPQIAGCQLSLKQINRICYAHIGETKDELQSKGASTSLVFAKTGPLWYRGFFGDKLEEATVATILDRFEAKRVVVGHTVVDEIATLHNGRVYAIDVKHAEYVANARPNAIVWDEGKFYKVNYRGSAQPIEEAGEKKPDVSTIAFKAIREDNMVLLKSFLANGNDINALYSSKKYPLLHYAIEFGSIEAVNLLMKNGADPNSFFAGKTALMHAIKFNKFKSIKILLENNIDVDVQNHRKQTALYYVARYGTRPLARLLVEHGANVNNKDQAGITPFQFAVKNSNTPVAKYLKSVGM